jgi:hypothetical protein
VLQLTDQSAVSFLRLLTGRELVAGQLVCRAWQVLLAGDSGYAGRVLQAREADAAERRAGAREEEFEEEEESACMQAYRCCYWIWSYDEAGDDEAGDDDYWGYGSG